MLIAELKNQKIIIVGFGGKEGLSIYRFLRHNFPKKELAGCDTRKFREFDPVLQKELEDDKYFKFFGGQDYLDSLLDYELIIKSPGVNPRQEAIEKALEHGVKMTSATNIFLANRKGKVIGVTGSKGKSTTAVLIHAALIASGFKSELIGNIGYSSLDFLGNDSVDKWYVMELSSYQLENLEGYLDYSVLVNFFPDHLDYHGSLQAYLEAKLRLPRNTNKAGAIFYNSKILEYSNDKNNWVGKIISFNNEKDKFLIKGNSIISGKQHILSVSDLKIKGKHNLENILAVLTITNFLKLNLKKTIKSIKDFDGLPHRLEMIGKFGDLTFIDDAISTTPESTLAALDSFEEQVGAIILGGQDRGYNFENLIKKLAEKKISVIALFPESGDRIAKEIENIDDYHPIILKTITMDAAVNFCIEKSPHPALILLSCASPSYSIFKNFEEKGKKFKKAILNFFRDK